MLASDYQHLINVILKETEWPALAPELDDINLLAARLQNAVFSHISQSVNLRADYLAKEGRSRAQTFSDVNVMVLRRPALVASLIKPE